MQVEATPAAELQIAEAVVHSLRTRAVYQHGPGSHVHAQESLDRASHRISGCYSVA